MRPALRSGTPLGRRLASLVAVAVALTGTGAPVVGVRPALGETPAVFAGDPVAPGGAPWVILPGVPLVTTAPGEKFEPPFLVIDPEVVGDVDVVVRTGGSYTPGSAIPPPWPGVAAAPEIVAGGRQFPGGGTEAPYRFILSDGSPSPPAGAPLVTHDIDGRGTLVVAYADLDGDGFIGPTSADGDTTDLATEEQEPLMPVGRRLTLFSGGVAGGALAVSTGLPASAGGLGLVLAGGGITGSTPPLYKDGPWISTLTPAMWPLDPDRIIGGENAGPPDPIGLVDIEVEAEWMFRPAPGTPLLGTPYAIPLDGSSITNDLLRAVSGPPSGAAFVLPVDRAGFVADALRRVQPAIDEHGHRELVEPATSLVLSDDGPGNGRTLQVFLADRLGNQADPPPGGATLVLEATGGIRIAAPDLDADPTRETIAFSSPGAASIVVDDTGDVDDSGSTGGLLAVVDGLPAAALRASLAPSTGGPPPGALSPGRSTLLYLDGQRRDRARIVARFDADPATLDLAHHDLTITLRDGSGVLYTRTLAPGSMRRNASGRTFKYREPDSINPGQVFSLYVKRTASAPRTHTLRAWIRRLDLSGVDPGIPSLVETVAIGSARFEATLTCTENASPPSIECRN